MPLLFSFVFGGCAHSPLVFQSLEEGKWTSEVLVKDFRKKSEYPLSVDFALIQLDRLRMDVTTPSGFYIASLVVKDGRFQAIAARERKYHSGAITRSTLKKVLKVPVDPRWFNHWILDRPLPHWQCDYNEKNWLEKCEDKSLGMTIHWSERELARKRIIVKLEQYEISIRLRGYQEVVADEASQRERLFVLKKPSSYRHHKWN